MGKRFAVILAAGEGTRMKSKLYKVLHPVAGKPMVLHVINQLEKLSLQEIATVVGFGADDVVKTVGERSKFILQEKQLGTGHAVQQAEDLLKDREGTTLVIYGDTPLLTSETLEKLFKYHEQTNAKATILTTKMPDPTGYGRIIRNEQNQVERIIEHADATDEEKKITEINTGTCCFDNKYLFEVIQQITNDNAQGEYYLTDVIEILKNNDEKVEAFLTDNFEETLGVNDRIELSEAEKVMRRRINESHMKNGVTIIDPDNCYIEADVVIDPDVTIHPGVVITGKTVIHSHTEIGPYSEIKNCQIGKNTFIKQSVVRDSIIGNDVHIGPYAHIRPETSLDDGVSVGNYVEVKKASVGKKTKLPHLSYVGDARIGSHTNLGCGTITVNYDGKDKHTTTIGDDAFVGCNTNLIAPVTVGDGSFIAAGSTITNDIPEDALSIARAKQVNKEGYAKRLRKRKK